MRTGLSLISVLMSAGALGAELPREAAEVALASLIALGSLGKRTRLSLEATMLGKMFDKDL